MINPVGPERLLAQRSPFVSFTRLGPVTNSGTVSRGSIEFRGGADSRTADGAIQGFATPVPSSVFAVRATPGERGSSALNFGLRARASVPAGFQGAPRRTL